MKMSRIMLLLLLLLMVGFSTNLFAMTKAERAAHDKELRDNYETHESLYIYSHRPMNVKVAVKRKYLDTGVNSKSLRKLKWERKKSWTKDKLVTEKQDRGKTFKTKDGDIFSDYYCELRVPYRRYLLTSEFADELKKYEFKMDVAAAELAIAVAAGITAFICPEASEILLCRW